MQKWSWLRQSRRDWFDISLVIKSIICRWYTKSSVWTVSGKGCAGCFGICESSHGGFPYPVKCLLFCSQHPGVCCPDHVHSPPMPCIQTMHAPARAQRCGSSSSKNVEKMDSSCVSWELQLIVLKVLFYVFGGDDP